MSTAKRGAKNRKQAVAWVEGGGGGIFGLTAWGIWGKMVARDMYIPTQEERYSKVAGFTLFLCVLVPSGIVLWLYGNEQDLLSCAFAFLEPPAVLLRACGLGRTGAFLVSAAAQAVAFFCMRRSERLTPKGKLTLAVTWGMLWALILRLLIAWQFWQMSQQAAG